MPAPAPPLELESHPAFERRFHRFQRFGWLALLALVVAAMLGVLGTRGPLADTVAAGEGLRVDYPRWARYDSDLVIRAEVEAVAGETFVLEFAGPWRQALRIEDIVPQPRHMAADARALVLEFEATGGGVQQVELHALPTAPGRMQASLGLRGRAPAQLRAMVWP